MSVRRRKDGRLVEYGENNQPCNFSDEVVIEEKQEPTKSNENGKVNISVEAKIPEKYFMLSNLKTKLPDYADRRRHVKNAQYQDYWTAQINELLSVYNENQGDKYHLKLTRAIMQIVEDYMIYAPKLGACKKYVCMSILKRFFDNNEELLSCIIEDQLAFIEHSTLFRRLMARVEIAFFSKN
jgi:hypothetical protein